MADPLITFVHLHKTGGMTLLREIIASNYAGYERLQLHGTFDLETCANRVRESGATLKVVSGHFRYGLHEHLERPCRYFTMLRDPIRRVHSLYHYYEAQPSEWCNHLDNRGLERRPLPTLEEFLECGLFRVTDNGQVRALSGVGEAMPYGEVGRKSYNQALQNLNCFDVVGITERFDVSLLLLADIYGWRHIHYARTNANEKKPDPRVMPIQHRRVIEQHTQWDARLYDAGLCRLEEQAETYGCQERLKHFQLINRQVYQRGRSIRMWLRDIKHALSSAYRNVVKS